MFWSLLACSFLSETEEPPSVILIIADTLRADHVGVYGAQNPVTPTLDALAKKGQFFTRAYAHSGWTLPSTTSLFTGLYPHEHRVGRSSVSTDQFGSLSTEEETLAELFAEKGYRTGAVINNTFLAPTFGLNQGFEQYFYQGSDNSMIRSAKESTTIGLKWWQETAGQKFLVLHYMEPHMDLDPPESTRGTFLKDADIAIPFDSEKAFYISEKIKAGESADKEIRQVLALYDEEILSIDREMIRLVSTLKDENIIFVFTSDHGEEFWEQGGFEHGHHTGSLLTRVPLIVWGSGIEANGGSDSVVSHSDLFHSILGLVAIEPPQKSHGLNIINQDAIPVQAVLSENTLYDDPMLSVVNREYRLEINQRTKGSVLWKLDQNGIETVLVRDNMIELARPLYQVIEELRGGIEAVDQVSGPVIPDSEMFQQLMKLGYLKE
jgi:arylsulfatase A-like enzyme